MQPLIRTGKKLSTDTGVSVDQGFIAHFQVPAAKAVAASAAGVLAATNLGAAVQTITTGLTNPAVPRALSIVGNVSGITGNVVITGTNYARETITETIALNGTTTVHGAKAFKTVTSVTLPVQVHTPVAQVETATAAGTVTTAGNAAVTVTSVLFEENIVVDVPVALNDNAAAIALAIRTALAADADIAEHFTVSGATDKVILTAKTPAANDATLNIAIDDGTGEGASEGVTTAATSANTTAGVPYDTVSVGWNDKLGLPYQLARNTVIPGMTFLDNAKETTEPTVTTSTTALESNTIDLNSALNGKAVDVYLVV